MVRRSRVAAFRSPVLVSGGSGETDRTFDGFSCEMSDVWNFPLGMGTRRGRGSYGVRGFGGSMLGLLYEGSRSGGCSEDPWSSGGPGAETGSRGSARIRSNA